MPSPARDYARAQQESRPEQAAARLVATYDYVDELGKLLFQVVRFQPKKFAQRQPDGKGGWLWSLKGVRRVLYRLPEVVKAELALVVEGEKDAVALARLGLIATTCPMGAGKWQPEYSETLRSKHVVILPDNDEPGREHARQVAASLHGVAASVKMVELPGLPDKGDLSDWLNAGGTKEELLRLVEAATPLPEPKSAPGGETTTPTLPVARRLADVEAKPIRWLWPGRIARGKVSMLAGHPGLGKSQVTASLAAIVSTGGRWPVDGTPCERGSALILSAEDDPADTIRPRLEAAGADLNRCHVLEAAWAGYDARGEVVSRPFSLETDLGQLEALLDHLGDVALVVIDPISAYLGATDSHRNSEVRGLLAPLSVLAGRHGAAVVCVNHLNQTGGSDALLRVVGSIAFTAAARAAYLVAEDAERPERRLFLPLKNNLAEGGTGLAFRVEGHQLPGGIDTSRVSWDSEPVTMTANEALRTAAEAGEERSAVRDAKEFLEELLADGSLPSKQVRSEADQAGLTWATVRRAQQALGVVVAKEGMKGPWTWQLPPKMLKFKT
jgi:energy-coupling factor transporter ATP-binding protein EcfA2